MSAVLANLSARRLTKQVDELGMLNAQISRLQQQADAIKKTLKESGYEEILGTTFRAVISTSTSSRLDSELVRAADPDLADLCTYESTSTRISLYDL